MHGQRDLLDWQDEYKKRECEREGPAEKVKALQWNDALEVSGENGTDGVRSSTYCRSLALTILNQWASGLDRTSHHPAYFGNGDPVVALRV